MCSQTSQVSKTWELNRTLAGRLDPFVRHVEHESPRFDDVDYVQRIEDRVATAAGVKSDEIRITWGEQWYGFLLPQGVLYISFGLLKRVSSEAELAGLLAHEMAHKSPRHPGERFEQCVLAAGYLPVQRRHRASERLATERAMGYMKSSGYDPSALLDLFSQVAYENQLWSKAIVAEDLLSVRAALEAETEPLGGYAIDDSEFARYHGRLPGMQGSSPRTIIVQPKVSRSDH